MLTLLADLGVTLEQLLTMTPERYYMNLLRAQMKLMFLGIPPELGLNPERRGGRG
jgi:hypothetical protein